MRYLPQFVAMHSRSEKADMVLDTSRRISYTHHLVPSQVSNMLTDPVPSKSFVLDRNGFCRHYRQNCHQLSEGSWLSTNKIERSWLSYIFPKVAGLDLESYLQAKVFRPLSISSATFFPYDSEMAERVMPLHWLKGTTADKNQYEEWTGQQAVHLLPKRSVCGKVQAASASYSDPTYLSETPFSCYFVIENRIIFSAYRASVDRGNAVD